MTKKWEKATISRSNLRHKFFKTGTEESKKGFNRQKNLCQLALQNNRKVWKTVAPLFSRKAFCKESIIFNNNNKIPVTLGN